ncbi:MAG: hypothetical protein H0U71_08140 [Gammaproteobacteria bacterium]|nr:hypothetical protein [Gammaproteobacteria bacterium]
MGSIAGATEVIINHPLWRIKTRMQTKQSFTLKPNVLYSGIVPNAASMIPTTAMQVGFNGCFQNLFFKDAKELSNSQQVTTAFLAGTVSSLVSCPTEMVMTHQTKEVNFYPTAKNLYQQGNYQRLFTALPATALREGMFAAFFLVGTPMLKKHISPYCTNDNFSSLVAGMGAGLGATIASQGIDSIKTEQQSAAPKMIVSFNRAIKNLYTKEGVYGFFKGSVPRGIRVMSAVTILSSVKEKMENRFNDYDSRSKLAP